MVCVCDGAGLDLGGRCADGMEMREGGPWDLERD